jgi:hypothetical protein
MKLTELKKIIQEEITKILSEQPQPAPTKPAPGIEIAEPDTETAPKTKPRRTISPDKEEFTEPEPKANTPANKIAKKIAQRFKQGKK